MALVMGYLGKSRNNSPDRVDHATVLRNPKSLIWLAIGGLCLFGALSVLAVFANERGKALYLAVFLGFVLLNGYMLAECLVERYEVGTEGLVFRTLFRGRGSATWEQVARIHFVPTMKWFAIRLRNGRVVRISVMMIGLPDLAQALLQCCPSAEIDEATRKILAATADGKLPAVWG